MGTPQDKSVLRVSWYKKLQECSLFSSHTKGQRSGIFIQSSGKESNPVIRSWVLHIQILLHTHNNNAPAEIARWPSYNHKLQCGIIWINLAGFPVYSDEYLSTTNPLLGKLKTRRAMCAHLQVRMMQIVIVNLNICLMTVPRVTQQEGSVTHVTALHRSGLSRMFK